MERTPGKAWLRVGRKGVSGCSEWGIPYSSFLLSFSPFPACSAVRQSHHTDCLQRKKHMILSIDTENASHKIQLLFLIEILRKVEVERNFNLKKGIYRNT